MRVIELRRPHFFKTRDRYAPPGSSRARAVARIIGQLGVEETLPGPQDVTRIVPPTLTCHARPIPGTPLLVCYAFDEATVRIIALMKDT